MQIQKIKKINLHQESTGAYPAFIEMTGSGFTSQLYGSDFLVYPYCLAYFEKGLVYWYTNFAHHKKIGSTIVDKYIKNKSSILSLYQKWQNNYCTLMIRFLKYFALDLSVMEDNELIRQAKEIYDFYKLEVSMPGFIDGFNFYSEARLNFLLQKFFQKKGIVDYQEIYAILSAPIGPSFIVREKTDLLKLRKYKLNSIRFNKRLESHLKKYAWIKSSYEGFIAYDKNEAIRELGVPKKFVTKNDFKKIKKTKAALEKKYKFSQEVTAIIRLTELFIAWQDLRKEYTLTFVTLQEKILKEISRRKEINFSLLKYIQTSEIESVICGSFRISKLRERKKYCLFGYEKGKINLLVTGEKARSLNAYFKRRPDSKTNEIRGYVANAGLKIGKAVIIKTVKDNNKIKKGNILVSTMTRPDHLPAMKKAAAIVTDEGGITCHAAIVSRELGVPCVIGTKIATRIFRDGDLIEVDANKGIVRKIQ